MGVKHSVTRKTCLKYFFSGVILVFSIPAFFHEAFLAGLTIATVLNLIWLIVYAVITFFTKKWAISLKPTHINKTQNDENI